MAETLHALRRHGRGTGRYAALDELWDVETLPLLYENQPVLMTKDRQQAVVRVGVLREDSDASEAQAVNWSTYRGQCTYCANERTHLAGSAARIANSAYVTRERVGKGQVILFSGQPNFRGSTRGVGRIWLNALVYGAGLGTSPKVAL